MTKIEGGCILLARIIMESAIWREDPHILKLFIYLIMRARHNKQPKKYPGFKIGRGELVTSLQKISDDNEYYYRTIHQWSRPKISRMLGYLREKGYIEILADTYGTHIKIKNYDDYQDLQKYFKDELADASETQVKRKCNASETQVKTNNNDNNDNNVKNGIIGTGGPPTQKQVKDYIKEKGYPIDPNKFWNHYNSNGWKVGKNKMKNWHSAVATWLPDKYDKKSGRSINIARSKCCKAPVYEEAGMTFCSNCKTECVIDRSKR